MLIGCHESIAGGVSLAYERAQADGAESLQIFTRSARGWATSPLDPEEVARFRAAAKATGMPCVAHGSYLTNLAAPPGPIRNKSVATFAHELTRCHALGVRYLITHPGANEDTDRGLTLVALAIDEAYRKAGKVATQVLIEVTAGQGVTLGHDFAHLAAILRRGRSGHSLGVCLDTCHLFAAGHDIATEDGYHRTLEALGRAVALSRVKAFHLNDCKKPLGCRVDRHENIGKGTMGLLPFRLLVNDPRFARCPAVLETPDPGLYKKNIKLLKGLRS